VMSAAVVAGLGMHLAEGLPLRLPPEAARLAMGGLRNPDRGECLSPPVAAVRDGRLCQLGIGEQARPTFVLWGDSHAEMLSGAVGAVAARAGRTGLFAGYPGCPPLLGVSVASSEHVALHECREFNEAMLESASQDGIDTVILAAHWSLYATGTRYRRAAVREVHLSEEPTDRSAVADQAVLFQRGLENMVTALAGAGKKVVIVAPVPEVAAPVPATLALAAWFGHDVDISPALDSFVERNRIVLSALAELTGRPLVRVVYPHAALCDETSCRVESDGRALYADDNHLSVHGAGTIRHIFEDVL